MKDVLIATSDGFVTVSANVVVGGLAVHRVYRGINAKVNHKKQGEYTVTHLSSGLSCCKYQLNYKQAVNMLYGLLRLDVNWMANKEHINSKKAIIVEYLKSYEWSKV